MCPLPIEASCTRDFGMRGFCLERGVADKRQDFRHPGGREL
jgi:hypothetical protein